MLLRDGQARASQVFPFSSWNSEDPEKLWAWMEAYEQRTGGRALAIPHNGNLSNGRMYAAQAFDGSAITKDYAERRQRWEPVQEIVQMKGASESHPKLSPSDEFLEYGIAGWELGNLTLGGKLTPEMMPTSYVRAGFMRGLEHEAKLGVNPFKSGIIGSSDAHNALPFVEEDNFFGKFPGQEPRADRWKDRRAPARAQAAQARYTWQYLAAGYAAVWATENTREAVFDAMTRRETYGTSGTRMTVRFFGGYDFTPDDAQSRYLAEVGYTKGVPMGGDLKPAPAGKAPTFLVAALKDPQGANLDRIQVIKGWLDASGTAQEKVYDVVWSGDRKPGKDGKLPPVGDTVDVARATYTNTIGAAELATVWKDPDFRPGQRAFYYARVIEIPTPRWTAYDQVRFGVKMSADVPDEAAGTRAGRRRSGIRRDLKSAAAPGGAYQTGSVIARSSIGRPRLKTSCQSLSLVTASESATGPSGVRPVSTRPVEYTGSSGARPTRSSMSATVKLSPAYSAWPNT